MSDPKATPKCVSIKCEVGDLFDKTLKADVLKQIGLTVKALIDKKGKGMVFDNDCKDGWMLRVTVTSLTVDDPNKPTSMEAKVSMEGVALQGTANVFKASGKATAKVPRGRKLVEVAKLVVSDAVEDPLTQKAIPHMLTP